MKPIALLSCDTTPDYLALLPIVCKSWELQNFGVELAVVGFRNKQSKVVEKYLPRDTLMCYYEPREIASTNSKIYTQCIRLYMSKNINPERYCILSDADMFIGSSFLYRDFDKLNVFGWDLTGYGQVPMCYVGMTAGQWGEVMQYEDHTLESDLEWAAERNSPDWYRAWGADQDILTKKLMAYGKEFWHQIPRGNDPRNSGLPLGRWDRHNWQMPSGEIHDVHLMRDPFNEVNQQRIRDMVNIIYPKENWEWVEEYIKEFKAAEI